MSLRTQQREGWQARRRRYAANLPGPPFGVARVHLQLTLTNWGCPGCNTANVRLPPLPHATRDVYSEADWLALCGRLIAAVEGNYCGEWPWIPCAGAALPLAPFICCVYHCLRREQVAAVQRVLAEESGRLRAAGLQWSLDPPRPWNVEDDSEPFGEVPGCGEGYYQLTLTWLPAVRPAFEAAHPSARRVSAEPYPFELLPIDTKEAVQSMAQMRLATFGAPAASPHLQVAGYPLGFDGALLASFAPGQPPSIGPNSAATAATTLTASTAAAAAAAAGSFARVAPVTVSATAVAAPSAVQFAHAGPPVHVQSHPQPRWHEPPTPSSPPQQPPPPYRPGAW